MILVNGEQRYGYEGITLDEFLTDAGYDMTKIAVERNGAIAKRGEYGQIILQEHDSLEVVTFVGGG